MHLLLRRVYTFRSTCSLFHVIRCVHFISLAGYKAAFLFASWNILFLAWKPGTSLALLDEKQTANNSSEAGNKSPLRCYDMNDNSESACLLGHMGFVSTLQVQPGLARDRQSTMHFHKSFLDTTSRLCGWQSVAGKLPLHWQCKGAPLEFK